MRQFIKMILVLVLTVSVVSCKRPGQEQIIHLNEIDGVSLKADSLNLADDLLAPRKVFVLDSSIVVFEPRDTGAFLHFYDQSGSLTWKYGVTGNARNEYLSPNVFANGESLVILSMNGKYREIKKEGNEVEIGELQSLGKESLALGVNFLSLTSDGGTLVERASSDDMLVFSTSDGREFGYNEYPVDIPEKMHAYLKKNVISSSSYVISHELDTLFIAYKYYPVVGTVSVQDRHSYRTALSVSENNRYKIKGGIPYYDDPILFYTYASSSGKYFYALFQNGSKSSIKEAGESEIHVYSQDCKLQKRYVLDRRIYHFAVSQDDSMIYALGINKDYLAELYVYYINLLEQ